MQASQQRIKVVALAGRDTGFEVTKEVSDLKKMVLQQRDEFDSAIA